MVGAAITKTLAMGAAVVNRMVLASQTAHPATDHHRKTAKSIQGLDPDQEVHRLPHRAVRPFLVKLQS
jgi:hypothetical protein